VRRKARTAEAHCSGSLQCCMDVVCAHCCPCSNAISPAQLADVEGILWRCLGACLEVSFDDNCGWQCMVCVAHCLCGAAGSRLRGSGAFPGSFRKSVESKLTAMASSARPINQIIGRPAIVAHRVSG
jgi:hypothetical protein